MNKFILSAIMSLAVTGSVHAAVPNTTAAAVNPTPGPRPSAAAKREGIPVLRVVAAAKREGIPVLRASAEAKKAGLLNPPVGTTNASLLGVS